MYSLKLAHLIHERTDAEVFDFYIDIRAAGKGYEEFYDRLLKEGVHFVRGRPAEVTDWAVTPAEEGKLIVMVEDTLIGAVRRIPVDMVVLSVGMEPHKDVHDLRKLFNISCSDGGWFAEQSVKVAPFATFADGIFIAGACQGPKDIPDTVAQAGAAAGAVIALIDKGYVELDPNTAFVESEFCTGCGTCVALCPTRAIKLENDKACVNEALCKACGLCAPACPEGAIQQHLFRSHDYQRTRVEGVLQNA
jgi:heterodisulfide reductase subunit A